MTELNPEVVIREELETLANMRKISRRLACRIAATH